MTIYKVAPAYNVNTKGRIVRDGWDLFAYYTVSGHTEWAERYPLKRDAVAAATKLNATEATTFDDIRSRRVR